MYYRCMGNVISEQMKFIGTGNTFDIKELLPDVEYQNLTEHNFVVEPTNNTSVPNQRLSTQYGVSTGGSNSKGVSSSSYAFVNITKSYNAETGILTCGISCNSTTPGMRVYYYKKED